MPTPFDNVPWLVMHPVLVHLASVPAVAYGSYLSLNRWRAVSALSPEDVSDEPAPSTMTVLKENLSKFRNQPLTAKAKKILAAGIFIGLWASIQCFFVFILPKIKSQSAQNWVFCTLLVLIISTPMYGVLDVVWPLGMQVRYHRSNPEGPIKLVEEPVGDVKVARRKQVARIALALCITAGVMTLASYGVIAHLPFVAAAFTLTYISGVRYPTMKIKTIVAFMSGYLTIIPTLALAIGLVVEFFSGDDTDGKKDNQDDQIPPSQWIISLVLVFGEVFGVLAPALVTAMTLRFEHSLSADVYERPADVSPDAPVAIPRDFPSFPKPIFTASMVSLFTSLAIVEGISIYYPQVVWIAITPLTIYFSVPIVFASTAVAAAYHGKLGAWWRYTEVWTPQKKKGANGEGSKDLDESEQGLLSAHDKEASEN
ncbi:hypothetical protein IAU60_006067 [Kwoniella sp. DSM 27419]